MPSGNSLKFFSLNLSYSSLLLKTKIIGRLLASKSLRKAAMSCMAWVVGSLPWSKLSYKGGSVSVDSALQSQKSVEEEDHDEVIIRTNTISTPVKKSGKSHAASEPAKEKETPKEEKPVAKEPAAQPKKEVEKEEQGVPGISLKIVGQIDLEKKPKQEKKPKSEPEKPAKPQEKQPVIMI